MYQGKYHKRSRRRSGKSIALLVALLLIVGMTVGGTFAFLIDVDDRIDNAFTPSKVTTSVEETLTGNTKSNVSIKNTGDTEAYIRAAVVITWQDESGNVYSQKPVEGTDYTIKYNLSSEQGTNRWIKGEDGFYYWTSPVLSEKEDRTNCMTGVLIESCKALTTKTVGDGDEAVTYSLAVEIIGSGIQSVPTSVVITEWDSGVSNVSNDGTLTIM